MIKNISLSDKISQSSNQVSSKLDDESVLLHIKNGEYYKIDKVGTEIWSMIEEPVSITELCDKVQEVFNVEKKQCEKEVLDFLSDLLEEGLIEVH